MEQAPAIIKNNDQSLKTCILYEVLEKKPIFDSYRNFCNLVGQDAMEYPEFEFWYYRFYHGQVDFDYDRSADPVPKTLMDIPISSLYKITEHLDTVERTYLRSMNKAIKDIADSHAPSFDKMEITAYGGCSMEWRLDNNAFHCYRKNKGCVLQKPNGSKIKSRDSYLKIISSFEKLESCELTFSKFENEVQFRRIAEALGVEIPFGPLQIIKHRYQIPESNEYLEFKMEDEDHSSSIKIVKIR
ncbi:hypothetical protein B9Z55_026924 [Caenorhabditis nigoni]|uniref:F-box domain-containing protein n=1 Tax=Caenorhabditis nigoni TaxID=1611254 RepID=A0A2G5SII1_9PELO|nr:hypothetical protein B9Z55_026924 [Caenorhabditis nigoni]